MKIIRCVVFFLVFLAVLVCSLVGAAVVGASLPEIKAWVAKSVSIH